MDNTIDTLQIEIESSTTDAQRGLTKLKNSLQKLTEMSNAVANMNSDGISKLKEMAQGVESLANAGSNPCLSAAVSELRKLSKIDFSNLGAGSEKISEIADKVGEITNANPTSTITPPETSTETVPIAPSVDVEETKGKLSQLKNFAANIFSSIKTGATTVFGGVAKVIGGAFKGIVTVFQKLGSAAKSVFGAMKKLGSYIGGKLKGAVGGATKKFSGFIRSMGRVAMYRAIRFILSQIATVFKEGTNNVYQYSKAIGGNLASSMDRIASSFLYFKNSIGAMVAPLINALAPAIEYVIDKAVALINVLNQLFAKLSGASTWTKAVKTQTEYAEAAGGAAEAAKSLTAGFDELNVLSDSGGGGGAGGMDYGSMFEEMQLDSDFAKWIDQIKGGLSMAIWIEPIFDRTEEDVSFAEGKIKEWIAVQLTGNPVETYDLKGCLNLSDLNRIEGNIQYLTDRLDELHYFSGASSKVWERSGLPTERDIRRILSNIRYIIAAYHQQEGVSDVPEDMATYSDINAIEENLYRIKQLLDSMVNGFQKSGMFTSGGMRMLPTRR